MRALRLIGGLDARHGGPPVVAINGCIALQRAGVDMTLAFPIFGDTGTGAEEATVRLKSEGVDVVAIPATARPGGTAESWGWCGAFARWIGGNRGRYDVVHCDGAWQMATARMAFSSGRAGPPLVLTPHESLTAFDIAQTQRLVTRLVKRPLRHFFLKRFDLVIVASALEARDSVPAGSEASPKVVAIPHPVCDEQRPMPVARAAAPGGAALRLGFIGRLHGKKNLSVLLQALGRADRSVSLSVAGTGPEESALRSLAAQSCVSGRVDWLGFVSGEAKDAFFRDIDVLVMPSAYECFGMAAAEALAAGIPVLMSESTGIAEIVRRHGGGEIVAADADALGSAIDGLARSPDRLSVLSQQAVEAAAATLTFSAYGAAVRDAYERLARHG